MSIEAQPRPEHPRPDLQRDNWLSLNGEWEFAFDDSNIGEQEAWHLGSEIFDQRIIVPFPYQSKLSGIWDEGFHDIVWYRRQFDLPADFMGKKVFLHIGAVDYQSKIWLNGELIGTHTGGYSPIDLDIATAVKESPNVIVLKVVDKHADQPRGKQDSQLRPSGCRYMRVTGIWQSVWLESVGMTYIQQFRLTSDMARKKVSIVLWTEGEMKGIQLEVRVLSNGAEFSKRSLEARRNQHSIRLPLTDLRAWSPECPNLYGIEFRLTRKGETVDEMHSYFGVRDISIKRNRILLNGEPYFLKLALDQGYYLDGIYTAPSDLTIRKDVESVKKLGLNGVRKHQQPPDPRYLYWADVLGALVWEEMADWGMNLRRTNIACFLQEWETIINRDFNHPCVVAWVPFNERDPAESKEARLFITAVYKKTKRLDPTRIVVDNSGYNHTISDLTDIHDYTAWEGGHVFRQGWAKNKEERKGPYSPHQALMSKGFRYKGQPIVISEYGGWGMASYRPIVDRPRFSYGAIIEDEQEFLTKYRDVTEAIMAEPSVSGFCYTQLYDVEGEVNGFMTYDRRWKLPPEDVGRINKGRPSS